jgi:hypothetical protein
VNSTADLQKPRPPAPPPSRPKDEQKAEFKVTYRPGPQDMAVTIWNGIRFEAGRPVTLSYKNKRHYIEVDLPKQIDTADGSYVTRSVASRISMIDRARENWCFEVEGTPRAIKPIANGRKPQTAEEYRSWAQTWIALAGTKVDGDDFEIQTPREMLERWDDESAMRERLGVGEEDVGFLKPFFDMKMAGLKKDMATKYAAGDGGPGLKAEAFTDD